MNTRRSTIRNRRHCIHVLWVGLAAFAAGGAGHASAAPPAPTHAGRATTAYPRSVDFDKAAIEPSAAQDAVTRRVSGDDLSDNIEHPGQPATYTLAQADLNDDGRPDLIVWYGYDSGNCGSLACSGIIVMATPRGHANRDITLTLFHGEIDILAGTHHGMHGAAVAGSVERTNPIV